MVKLSMRRLFWAAAGIAAVGLAACGSSSSTAKPKPTTSTSKPATTTTGSTGRPTQWRDVTAEWKARAPGPFAKGPDAVAEDLAAVWRGGDTSTVGMIVVVAVRTGEPLVVVLRETGGADATVASTDVEITLEGGDEGWAVISARAQSTCVGTVDQADPTRCV
ncbi:MAG: hypothetical protein ABIP21_11755 [Acidimicrobiia bacterium]